MLNAISNNKLEIKRAQEKEKIVEKLKNSLETLAESPKMKLGIYASNGSNKFSDDNYNNNSSLRFDEVTQGRGRRHFHFHPGMQDNVSFEFRENFASNKERIDQFVDHYLSANKQEKIYNFSPNMYAYYNKEKVDPTIKYSDKVRHQNVSPGNLERKFIFTFVSERSQEK